MQDIPSLKDTGTSELLKSLQDKLLGQAGAVSSQPSALDTLISEETKRIEEARVSREAGTRARFERARIEAGEAGEARLTSELEARRGFGTNMGVVRQIRQDTEKSLRDLDLREQEALALGATEDAATIRNLKIQQLTFQQTSQQNAYKNLLDLAGVRIKEREVEREEALLPSRIKLTEAQTAEALANARKSIEGLGVTIDENTAKVMANAFRRGDPSFLTGLKNPSDFGAVYAQVLKLEESEEEELKELASQSRDVSAFMKKADADPRTFKPELVAKIAGSFDFSKNKLPKEAPGFREIFFPSEIFGGILGIPRTEEQKRRLGL